jgi:hypothetical protein
MASKLCSRNPVVPGENRYDRHTVAVSLNWLAMGRTSRIAYPTGVGLFSLHRGVLFAQTPHFVPRNRILLDTLIITQLLNKFIVFYETRGFITMSTRSRHWNVSWAYINMFEIHWILLVLSAVWEWRCNPTFQRLFLMMEAETISERLNWNEFPHSWSPKKTPLHLVAVKATNLSCLK